MMTRDSVIKKARAQGKMSTIYKLAARKSHKIRYSNLQIDKW